MHAVRERGEALRQKISKIQKLDLSICKSPDRTSRRWSLTHATRTEAEGHYERTEGDDCVKEDLAISYAFPQVHVLPQLEDGH